jgi:Tol biopolymer transport system component
MLAHRSERSAILHRSRAEINERNKRESGWDHLFVAAVAFLVPVSTLSGCWQEHDRSSSHDDVAFSIAPQGDSLVFDAKGAGNRDLYRLDLKRGDVIRIAKTPDYETEPSLSPDGKSVAFVARPPGDRGNHIFIQSVDGGNRRQLTRGDSSDTSPAFSPDGSRVAFARSTTYNSGGLASDWNTGDKLFVMKVDGSSLRQINTNGLYPIDPSFSPDGKQIVFRDLSGLFLVAADGSEAPKSAGGLKGYQATFSPDGRWLLYTAGRYEPDLAIFVARVDGSEVRQLVSGRDVDAKSPGGIYHPLFTPDGKRIIFLHAMWPNGPSGPPKRSLWEVTIEGGHARELANYKLFDEPLSYFGRTKD